MRDGPRLTARPAGIRWWAFNLADTALRGFGFGELKRGMTRGRVTTSRRNDCRSRTREASSARRDVDGWVLMLVAPLRVACDVPDMQLDLRGGLTACHLLDLCAGPGNLDGVCDDSLVLASAYQETLTVTNTDESSDVTSTSIALHPWLCLFTRYPAE